MGRVENAASVPIRRVAANCEYASLHVVQGDDSLKHACIVINTYTDASKAFSLLCNLQRVLTGMVYAHTEITCMRCINQGTQF